MPHSTHMASGDTQATPDGATLMDMFDFIDAHENTLAEFHGLDASEYSIVSVYHNSDGNSGDWYEIHFADRSGEAHNAYICEMTPEEMRNAVAT